MLLYGVVLPSLLDSGLQCLTMERWVPIRGWESTYVISDAGNVYSHRRKAVLSGFPCGAGYLAVTLADKPRRRRAYLHALVAEAFLPPKPGPKSEINHINLVKTDNRVANLEWTPHDRNQGHAAEHGRMLKHHQRRLNDDDVRWVRANRSGSAHKMATQIGVTSMVIYQIWKGLTYRDIS